MIGRKGKFLIISAALIASGVALAIHYGRWDCSECLGGYPTPDPDTRNFITTDVNQVVPAWRAGDTVKICNGTVCTVYEFTGMHFLARSQHEDNGGARIT
jgi:hypothetical protein